MDKRRKLVKPMKERESKREKMRK